MKAIILISSMTFILIFGGLVMLSAIPRDQEGVATAQPDLTPEDHAAAERVLRDLARERDRIQHEKEDALIVQQRLAVEAKFINDAQEGLQAAVSLLKTQQQVYDQEKEKSARKLAKMYEAMKPVKAAPIMSALDMDVILEIMQRMNERAAAKVLSYMDAGLAARISMRMSIKGGR